MADEQSTDVTRCSTSWGHWFEPSDRLVRRDPAIIEREQGAAVELAVQLCRIFEQLEAGEIELGREGGQRRIRAVLRTAELLGRCAERDRLLLAGLELRQTTPSARR
jgi:hypothetical protein